VSNHWTCHECGRETRSDACFPCPGRRHPVEMPMSELVERIVDARLRRIAERLRVPHSGLVPDAEVYVRAMLARAIEEELEER
jgi:hypothetical protein